MPLRRRCAFGAFLELLEADQATIVAVALSLTFLELASNIFGIVAFWFVETGGASISLASPGWLRFCSLVRVLRSRAWSDVQEVRHAEAQGAYGQGELHWGKLLES